MTTTSSTRSTVTTAIPPLAMPLNNDWWDSQWSDLKAMKQGLDSEERDPRGQVFGRNMIEIKQKSIPELLVDEVREVKRNCVIYL